MIEIAGLYIYAYLIGAAPTGYLIARPDRSVDIGNTAVATWEGPTSPNTLGKDGWSRCYFLIC